MCNKSGGTDHQGSMCTKEISFSPAPARKTRTKTRKPKFLSLRQELSEENSQESGEMTDQGDQQQQLNLFPLHPENLFGEKEIQDENMSYFFDADSGATLNGLLDGKSGGIGDSVLHSEEDSFSPSLTYAFGEHDGEEGACSLVRTALRHKERHAGEEKWVVYSQVVEKKEEEVSSCAAHVWLQNQTQLLSLKLDYQEILNAWSDKGPLFIETDSPQIVPDVHDDCQAQDSTSASHQVRRVPEGEEEGSSVSAMEEVVSGGEGWKRTGQREARVLRYKEKRQSRLFSKRIRYEVRKINAEKRPRIKGRFVKRS